MQQKFLFSAQCTLLALLLCATNAFADEIILTVPSNEDQSHTYYHELLQQSLEAEGHKVILKNAGVAPQKRHVMWLDQSEITLYWLVQSAERDTAYVPVDVGITNGLIGHRILFIPKGAQSQYDEVKNLDDFRKLDKIGAFGNGWFDVKVWRANNLKLLEEDGDWKKIYKKLELGNRGIDYFSRGFHEILIEAKENDLLDIEKKIMLIYDRDFRFYLSKKDGNLKPILTKALEKAKATGMIDKLLRKHYEESYKVLNFDGRVKIPLALPK